MATRTTTAPTIPAPYLRDEDWRKLWEERTGETYPWPGRRARVEVVRDGRSEQRQEFPAHGVIRSNDSGNALRLIRAHGHDAVFAPKAKGWFAWDGSRWVFDMGNVMMLRKAKAAVDAMFEEAMALEEDARNSLLKHAMLSGQQARLNAMIESARSHAKVVKYTDFDADPYLFNTVNATIDLRTGKTRKHDRNDLTSTMSPVICNPEAKCSRWLQFLDEIMLGDQSKVEFLKRARGYGLTGDSREEVLFILWGAGRNGKGVFKDTCHHIMGIDQYAKPTSFEMFTVRKGDEKLNDIAGLRGARDVTASESENSKRLAEAKLKQMTGRDPVVGEFKYQEQFSDTPQYKIWLVTNPKPRIVGTDDAIWDRVIFVPFLRYFADHERDKGLREKLQSEAPGILNWMIEGCLEWQRIGLAVPDSIRNATRQYRNEQNVLGHFIEDCCVVKEGLTVGKSSIYETYKDWATKMGEFVMTNTQFNEQFELLFESGKSSTRGRHWKGLGLKYQEMDGRTMRDVSDFGMGKVQ
jgi:putative DNA primase/helicase